MPRAAIPLWVKCSMRRSIIIYPHATSTCSHEICSFAHRRNRVLTIGEGRVRSPAGLATFSLLGNFLPFAVNVQGWALSDNSHRRLHGRRRLTRPHSYLVSFTLYVSALVLLWLPYARSTRHATPTCTVVISSDRAFVTGSTLLSADPVRPSYKDKEVHANSTTCE